VLEAIRGAAGGPVPEGAVGAGTGTAALGFKAGIGTSSRRVLAGREPCAVGVLVQSNFSGTLTILGVPIVPGSGGVPADPADLAGPAGPGPAGNSCMIVVAVDRALDSRQLNRIARRAVFAMGRTGADYAPASGDYAIAIATGDGAPVPDRQLGFVFAAVQDAVAEAIVNSLLMATTTTGFRGHVKYAVPLDEVVAVLRAAGVPRG
jgi:D-aminopeptidase